MTTEFIHKMERDTSPYCPFCGNDTCDETAEVTVWDSFHNSCRYQRWLCLNCDRQFNILR